MTPPAAAATTAAARTASPARSGPAARTARPAIRRAPAPRAPRRVSGPARQTRQHAGALPAPLGLRVGRRARALADARLLDRLIHGRAWIAIVAVALIGIVFMQVSLLRLNAGIGASVQDAQVLERKNAELRNTISRLGSGTRVEEAATRLGMVMPAADDFRYLTAGRAEDARVAAATMRPPDPVTPGTQTATTTTTVPGATGQTGTPAGAATTAQTVPSAVVAPGTSAPPTPPASGGAPAAPVTAPQQTAPPPVGGVAATPTAAGPG